MTASPSPPLGQGDKYDLINTVIGPELDGLSLAEYIEGRKEAGAPYSKISEEINALLVRCSRPDLRVSHESARRWDPSGNFVARQTSDVGARMLAIPPTTSIPPAKFQPPRGERG
jgi:hypothetical protein